MRRRALALTLLLLAPLAAPSLRAETARERAQKLMKTLAKDSDPQERADAARSLGSMGATDSVDALAKALSDPDKRVKIAASSALWKLGEVARPAIPALRQAFENGSAWVRLNCGGALEDLGTPRKELVPGYREVLASTNTTASVEAARRLQGHVPDEELLPVVQEALKDDEARSDAQEVLRKLEPKGKEGSSALVATLVSNLHNRSSSVQSDAVFQLARMKPVPKEAIPEMLELLQDEEASVRRSTCSAVGTMGGAYAAQTVGPLLEILKKDEEAEVRAAAASALGEIGPAGKAAIPGLIEALQKDKESKVREAACDGLSGMKTSAKAAIPALEAAQKDADGFVRNAAWRALLRVDPR
jgi:HEAT repeat protein